MGDDKHTLIDGKLHVYRRPNSRKWQCSTYLGGRNWRASTKTDNLATAMEFARDWYLDRAAEDRLIRRGLRGPAHARQMVRAAGSSDLKPGKTQNGPTFIEAASAFLAEYKVLTLGQRNKVYVENKERCVRRQLGPFFGDTPVAEITAGRIQEYRVHRVSPPQGAEGRAFRRPARSTLNQEMVTLRQILKSANRKGWIAGLPDMSAPYKASSKISHRAWFSPDEYKRLYEASRERARNPLNERWRGECEQFHDYVLFMVNTGLRPDEASALEFRDVTVVDDPDTGDRILEIEIRGKRGVGHCKSMPGAVQPFRRLLKRRNPAPTDLLFGSVQRELLNTVLGELNLKRDRDGNPRTAYSLRHTYICFRLMEGADIYQVAKNCRTSVEMIEKHYAVHLKHTIDASAVNRRKPKQRKEPSASKRGRTPTRASANAANMSN